MRLIAILLLFLTGISALAAGYSFIVEPSGNGIGISTEYLQYSPFKDFLIPGIILFTFNGLLSIAVAFGTILKIKNYPLFIQVQGGILTGWIIVQVVMVRDFNIMHLIILSVGAVLVFIGSRLKRNI